MCKQRRDAGAGIPAGITQSCCEFTLANFIVRESCLPNKKKRQQQQKKKLFARGEKQKAVAFPEGRGSADARTNGRREAGMIQRGRGALSARRFNSADAGKENTNVPGRWKHFCAGTRRSVPVGPVFPWRACERVQDVHVRACARDLHMLLL